MEKKVHYGKLLSTLIGFIEDVTVLIGIAVCGRPVGGIIHQPFYGGGSSMGRTIWGMTGVGVRGLSPPSDKPKGGLRVVVTRSHYSDYVDDMVKNIKPAEVIRAGGAGNKILMVLEGKADTYIYPSIGTKKWDTCAGDALLCTVGGKLTDIHGKLLSYEGDETNVRNRQGLIVTMSGHEEILAKVPKNVKKAFPYQ